MNFGLALKKINNGQELAREGNNFSLLKEKNQIVRKTKNGARTTARIASQDLLANDWVTVRK